MSTAEIPSGQAMTCPQHPGAVASFVCSRCQTAVCTECCYGMPDGSFCCKSCYHAEAAPQAASVSTPQPQVSGLRLARSDPSEQHASQPVFAPPPGQACVQHPNVRSVAKCRECGAGMCRTCDFLFPVNLHFCPVCVTSVTGKLSPRRKRYMITAFVLVGWSSIGFVCFVAGAAAGLADGDMGETLIGLALMLLVGFPVLIGTAFGMSARRPGGPNPVSVWVALIWNLLLLAGFILLMVIGSLAE